MGESEINEILASMQHEIWSHWMRYMFTQCQSADGGWLIPSEKVSRWLRQLNTPYDELSETEKRSDRDQADKIRKALMEGDFSIVSNKWIKEVTQGI